MLGRWQFDLLRLWRTGKHITRPNWSEDEKVEDYGIRGVHSGREKDRRDIEEEVDCEWYRAIFLEE